jgi:hypothetical protein
MQYFYLILGLLITALPHQSIVQTGVFGNIQPGGVVTAAIDSPTTGQAVQGAVVVQGSNAVDGFQSYEIDFTDAGDPNQSWIPIQNSTEPIQDGIMAVWDTSAIADGDYNLRLLIFKTDGSRSEATVRGVLVRNNTPLEIGSASPTVMYVTLGPGMSTSTPIPQGILQPAATPSPSTPAPLPTNPAEITAPQVMQTFGTGAALSIGVFVLLGAYVGIRAFLNGRK